MGGTMMMVPDCLQQLELDATADERAIRRAYAQKLKKLDQQADPSGFQSLRSAYDAALAWVRERELGNEAPAAELQGDDTSCEFPRLVESIQSHVPCDIAFPERSMHVSSSVHQGPNDEAIALARNAFAQFTQAFDAAAENPHTVFDVGSLQAILDKAMAGDALVNMGAREILERNFASLLIQGWKPGHEALFIAVTNLFRWDEDRRHLQRLGYVGVQIDRALSQRAMFDCLKPRARAQREALIARLRSTSAPTPDELQSSYWLLEDLCANFPTWLGIVTDLDNLPHWRQLHAALPPRKRGKPIRVRKLPEISYWHGWMFMLALVLLLKGIGPLVSKPSPPPTPIRLGVATTSELPATLPVLVGETPTPEVCEEISRIYEAFGTGTSFQDVPLGERFDRQIVACIGKLIWPQSTLHDFAIGQVLLRDRLRLVAEQKQALNLDSAMRAETLPKPTAIDRHSSVDSSHHAP